MASGQLGRLAGALKRMLLLKERVGAAPGGLSYFRRTERNDHGEEVEKRWVKFPASAGHGFYDPAAIAPEWSQWLNHVRKEPPTDEDIARAAAQRQAIRQKAAELQAEDAKRQLQAETIGLGSRPNRDAFTRQLTDPSLSRGGGQPSGAGASAHQTSSSRGESPRQRKQPPAPQASHGSASLGKTSKADDFQPAAWRPGT